ncbi:MAG: hypothetical protein A2413_16565, partial [Treponema sp. RIFOXYC1_FULL_61_9]
RATPLENNRPVHGTWTRPFDDVDPLGVARPFALPLPRWMRNYRVKEWQSFQAQDERYYLTAALLNAKYYRVAQVTLWDKETKEKLVFRKALPFGAWRFPRSLSNSSVTSRSYGFYFRIHDWLDADLVELDLDIEPTRKRPSFTAHVELDLARDLATPLVVSLPFSGQRFMYAYKALAPARGDLVFGGRHISFDPKKSSGILHDFKGFYPYRMRNTWASGFGFDGAGRRFGFDLAENQAKDAFRQNENALWLEGRLYPLPPVRITMPNGIENEWIIQDLEGMVDLTFIPREREDYSFDLLLTRCDYRAPLGVFNGMVMTSEGEKLAVRNLWGFGEKLYIRV